MRIRTRELCCSLLIGCLVACVYAPPSEWPVLTTMRIQHHRIAATCPAFFAPRPDGLWLATTCGYQNSLLAVKPDGSSAELLRIPYQLAAISGGPQGSLWVARRSDLFAIDADGRIRAHVRLPAGTWVCDIAAARDGSVWYADSAKDRLGRVSPDGHVVTFDLGATPQSVAVDSRGRVLVMFDDHIAEWSHSRLRTLAPVMGQVSMTGRFLVPAADGVTWVVGLCGEIGHLDARDAMRLIRLPLSSSCPVSLAPDRSGGAWFVDNTPQVVVVHVSAGGTFTVVPAGPGYLTGIAVDDRDDVWFANASDQEILSISARG